MVTLASNTIKCIVRELTDGGTTTKTFDLVTDYGAVSGANCDSAFLAYQTANANTSGNHRLYIPAGNYVVTLAARYFSDGFDNLHVLGSAKSGATWTAQITGGMSVHGTGVQYEDNDHSARIESASAGAYTITVKNDDVSGTGRTLAQIMALFEVGKWVFITEYDTQGYGFPVNHIFSEYHQIASKNDAAGTITLTAPLTRAFSDQTPEFSRTSNPDHGGPATIYAVRESNGNSALDRIGVWENIQFNNVGSAVGMAGNQVGLTNCNVVDQLWPGGSKSIVFTNTTSGSVEVDKICDYMEFDGCTLDPGIVFQSSQPAETFIRNSDIVQIVGTSRNITIENCTISNTLVFGPAFFGYSTQATVRNVTFSSATIGGSDRTYSLAGCTFAGAVIKGYVMALDVNQTITGAPIVGQTITGATSGQTATVASWDNTSKRMNLENVTGAFTAGETVTTPTLTAAKTFGGNKFGQEWAGPGCHFYVGSSEPTVVAWGNVVSYYREGALLCVGTDVSSWPSYTNAPINQIRISPCPALTFEGCTGNEIAVAWSTAPGAFGYGEYYYQTLTAGGVLSAAPPFRGRLVSITVNVTTAYTGTSSTLFWCLNDLVGIRLDGLGGGAFTNTTPPRFRLLVDLKTTGTRVFAPTGNSGVKVSDVEDDDGYNFIFEGTTSGQLTDSGRNPVTISGESSSVWPAFTVTIVTEV